MQTVIKLSVLGIGLILGGGCIAQQLIITPPITQEWFDFVSQKPIAAEIPEFTLYGELPLDQRLAKLEERSLSANSTLERLRSRYVLAGLQIQNRQPQLALDTLKGLEQEYPLMAEYIAIRRSQALGTATAWQEVLNQYPQGFAAGAALFALGRNSAILEQFPAHPRARSIFKSELARSPNRFDLLIGMATYFNDDPAIVPILNRLVDNHGNRLNPNQWATIARTYFERRDHNRAANAFSKGISSPDNLFLWGRSLQRTNRNSQATRVYSNLVRQFPSHPLAPRAILRMMDIAAAQNDQAQVNFWSDRLIKSYPDTASEGLLKKLDLQEKLGSGLTTRNLILRQYPNSNEAGLIKWRQAQQQARANNFKGAIATATDILNNNQSEIAAEAGYWGGKWAKNQGDQVTAQRTFKTIIKKYPKSYFAWRAAVKLGWRVGDFSTIRNQRFSLQTSPPRGALPAGSAVLQELFILGQDQDAHDRWQFETKGQQPVSPKEIFTSGVLRVGIKDHLRGLGQIESMYWFDGTPAQEAEIKTIIAQPIFNYSLYPQPYLAEISQWSNRLNLPIPLVLGLIRQESRFEPEIVSSAGAVGLMQIMPETGAYIARQKGQPSFSLRNPMQNIEFGTWYLDYTHRQYSNNTMLAVASYNAGPNRVRQWVNRFGLGDEDEFVQKIPYNETRDYVRQVLGNYWNYLRLYVPEIRNQVQSLQNSPL